MKLFKLGIDPIYRIQGPIDCLTGTFRNKSSFHKEALTCDHDDVNPPTLDLKAGNFAVTLDKFCSSLSPDFEDLKLGREIQLASRICFHTVLYIN